MQERLSRGALYDDVTGLPNRVLLEDRIGHALTSGRVDGSESIAVMILGLDAFDLTDESLGRGAGDELLRAVGERLRGALRPADTIGRFGGGEFGILLEVTGSADALAVAERVEGRLAAPFRDSDRDVLVTAHVGIAVGRPGEAVVDDLVHEAESALVQAKAHPTTRHALSDQSAGAAPAGGLDIAKEITRALEGLGRPPVRGPGSRAKRPVIGVGASSGGPPRSPAKRPA